MQKTRKNKWVISKKTMKMSIFGQIWVLLGQTTIFPKNPFKSLLSLYSPLTSCRKSEKTNDLILKNYRKSQFLGILGPFCPFLGQMRIFTKKWLHHHKHAMVFYLYAKNYKKTEKINEPFPRKQWKCLFLDKFGHFWAKQEFSRKIHLGHF